MPDQPIPDFSQQFSPGYVQATPMPGISSSYPGYPDPSAIQMANLSQVQNNIAAVNSLALQTSNNAKVTMALAQQNLMNSMHTAMLGTMTAFSDVTRRGGAMITAMSPVGRYNDFVGAGGNWALEGSFRREVGAYVGDMMGLDPYRSPLSRLIQGRRPEFLTEGEYQMTMGYGRQQRKLGLISQLESQGAGLGISGALMYAGMTGLTGFGIGAIGGLVADRFIAAEHAQQSDLLNKQLYVRTHRMGVGNQYMSSDVMKAVHDTTYAQDNPFAARFFGDNAVGNLFRPDIQFGKTMQTMMDTGMFANEALDEKHVINYVTKVKDTVEKFSRIAKVTHEVGMKLMASIKNEGGIHGNNMMDVFKGAAYTSNLTGVDMQQLVGMEVGAAQFAQNAGFNNYNAAKTMDNIVSSFSMMQSYGQFKDKNILDVSQKWFNYSANYASSLMGEIQEHGGPAGFRKYLRGIGGGSEALGYMMREAVPRNIKNLDEQQELFNRLWNEQPANKQDRDKLVDVLIKMGLNGSDPTVMQQGMNFLGGFRAPKNAEFIQQFSRLHGHEYTKPYVSMDEVNPYVHRAGLYIGGLIDEESIFNYKSSDGRKYNYKSRLGVLNGRIDRLENLPGITMMDDASKATQAARDKELSALRSQRSLMEELFKKVSAAGDNEEALLKAIGGFNGDKFNDQRYNVLLSSGETARSLVLGLADSNGKNISGILAGRLMAADRQSGLGSLDYANRVLGARNKNFTTTALGGVNDLITALGGKMPAITRAITGVANSMLLNEDYAVDTLRDIFQKEGLGEIFDKYIGAGKDAAQKVGSFLGVTAAQGVSADSTHRKFVRGLIGSAGFDVRSDKDLNLFKRGMNAYLGYMHEFFEADGTLKKGADTSAAHSKFVDLLGDSNTRKVLGAIYKNSPLDFEAIKRGKNIAWTEPQFDAIGSGMLGLTAWEPTEANLRELKKDAQKEAGEDPSDEAVKQLNTLLGDILKAMGHTPTGKPVKAGKEN